ncbi:MAG: F0F1 ATP synthase subunit epsilon [Candidatus Obscuribacterales bacterium]|nr:F0F1 ATP synthase subunit epsilon [Cyanobacteria bacterium SZAS LIN-5]RTL34736.1 MAG: F0F1 ATP synthase subunit epsilon [Candidatus Melainabacteria bacterium]
MPGALNLKIITPERVVLEQAVDEVSARAIDGELSILPNHQPLITALAIDVLRYKVQGEENIAAVIGGLLEVGENQVTVLSDVAELDTEIDEARAHDAKARAEAEKTQKTDKLDVYLSEMAMSRAVARLKAAELSKQRRRKHQV